MLQIGCTLNVRTLAVQLVVRVHLGILKVDPQYRLKFSASPKIVAVLIVVTSYSSQPIIRRKKLRHPSVPPIAVQAPQRCGREGGPSPKGPALGLALHGTRVTDQKRNYGPGHAVVQTEGARAA